MAPLVIPIVWSMIAGACLATGVIHLGASLRKPRQGAGLAFCAVALSVMCVAIFEILLMRAQTPAEFGATQRWMHIPVFTTVVSMVIFTRMYFRAGRLWLAYAVCGLRLLALVLNFIFVPNIEYAEITALRPLQLLGETVSVAVGVANPWVRIGEASTFLLLAFVADAAIAHWRRGSRHERRRAALVGGSLVFALAVAGINTSLLHAGVIHSIYLYSIPFSLVLVAIGAELSAELARSARLAGQLVEVEAELRQSEQRLDQAAEAAGIGTWEWDIVRDEIWATERGRALFGMAPGERIDFERFLEALHPDDRETARGAVDNSREKGGHYEREYRVVLPDGRTRWIHTRGGVDFGAGGKAVLMRGVSWDVTARKEAEERFRLVVEAAANGLIMLDAGGRITLVNAQAEAIFGYSRREFGGLAMTALVPEGLGTGREVAGRRRDGSEVALEIGVTHIQASGGPGVLVSILDIGERKGRDALLKQERAFLRQVIDIDPNLIFAKDRQGRFTLANKAVADLYGTTVEALIGSTDSDFNENLEEVEAFRRADLEVMDTLQELFIAEEHITDAAGRDRCLQTVKRPIVGEDGRAQQVLGVATDISARKQAELELGRQRNELAHLSRVTMVSELSGSLAHELNQPLTAILSNAQAALRFMADGSPDLAEVREILLDIVDDDKRAGQVIQGLRLLLKKGDMRREPLDVNDLVRDVLRLVRSDLLNAGVDVKAQLAPGLPKRSADRVQLQQVLLNLIVNGCDAMAGSAVAHRELVVSTDLADDECIRVCVTDRGPGIAQADAERLFEPFFTTKSHGLGLGLAICRNIMAAHGGRLWATNDAGSGMTFCFTLPENPGATA